MSPKPKLDALGRRSRIRPTPTGKRITPQPRDLHWFEKLAEHGPLPSSFLLAFAKDTHRSEKRAKERLTDLFNELGEIVDGALDSLNFTGLDDLPDELAALFELPNFENFTFDFGGNCTLCDATERLEGDFDGLNCADWQLISSIGIKHDTDQCNFLRVAAVEYCACPMPAANEGKTCDICPAGEEPGGDRLNNTIGIVCADLGAAPAVDGDKTCASIEAVADECPCGPATESDDATDEAEDGDTEPEPDSGAINIQSTFVGTFVVATAGFLGLFL